MQEFVNNMQNTYAVTIVLTQGSTTAGIATVTDQQNGFSYTGPVDTSNQASMSAFIQAGVAAFQASIINLAATQAAEAALLAAVIAYAGQ